MAMQNCLVRVDEGQYVNLYEVAALIDAPHFYNGAQFGSDGDTVIVLKCGHVMVVEDGPTVVHDRIRKGVNNINSQWDR